MPRFLISVVIVQKDDNRIENSEFVEAENIGSAVDAAPPGFMSEFEDLDEDSVTLLRFEIVRQDS